MSKKAKGVATTTEDATVVDSVVDRVLGRSVASVSSPTHALSVFQQLVTTYEEVYRIDETEKTKRRDIERQRQVALAQIHAQKEFLLKYLTFAFAERKENFRQVFKVVDAAISKRDNEQLALGLRAMTELAASNPFGPLIEVQKTRKALEDGGQVWEF